MFQWRGIDLQTNIRYSKWVLEPGLGFGLHFDYGLRIFQIPVYFGLGLNFNSADPIRNTAWALGAKARARFYITDNIALFGGAGWKGGLGVQTVEEKSRVTLDITQRLLYLEAGISVSLGM